MDAFDCAVNESVEEQIFVCFRFLYLVKALDLK